MSRAAPVGTTVNGRGATRLPAVRRFRTGMRNRAYAEHRTRGAAIAQAEQWPHPKVEPPRGRCGGTREV